MSLRWACERAASVAVRAHSSKSPDVGCNRGALFGGSGRLPIGFHFAAVNSQQPVCFRIGAGRNGGAQQFNRS